MHPYVHYLQSPRYGSSPSVDEWVKQLWDIYTMEYYLAIKKKKILLFLTAWIDLENIMLSETNRSKTYTIRFHSYVESNEQPELTNKIETDS